MNKSINSAWSKSLQDIFDHLNHKIRIGEVKKEKENSLIWRDHLMDS